MDNLRSVLSIVLSKIPPREILREEIHYDDITMEKFVKLAGYYVKNYSNDELGNLFSYIQKKYEEWADHVRGFGKKIRSEENNFNIFDAICIFSVLTLQEEDGEPVCKYEHMLRWRITSHELDEDVFTTAFLAYQDVRYINEYRTFSWRPIIRHNNTYLNKILSQGMADNHFHLKGSAPQFPLSWICMMNNVVSKKNRKLFDSYSQKRLSTIYSTSTEEEHIYILYLKAALIRCYLYAKITNSVFVLQSNEEIEDVELREDKIDRLVRDLLQKKDEILFYRTQIQNNISAFKGDNIYDKKCELDYALYGQYCKRDTCEKVNFVLSGERWFLYSMFQLIFSKNQKYLPYYNMFYAYLVIKETIRSELVQTNANIGFDNFSQYEKRKDEFIEDTDFEIPYIEMAVKGTIMNQNVRHLEARITPRNMPEQNRDYIRKFEKILGNNLELQKRYFYVFHFIKEKDDRRILESDIYSRHYRKRRNLRKQAYAIAAFRERYPREANRVRGIDACAKEIGCRPEVFGQTYRFLSNHIVYQKAGMGRQYEKKQVLKQLLLTYHVGEDYVDITDGLRAIDEAIQFLQLKRGSRLGHALALGTDVEEYYQIKKKSILISQQDYLDNIVWLYYRVKKFGLTNYEDLLLFIEQEYNKYFKLIYGDYICDDFFDATIKYARQQLKSADECIIEGYCNSHFNFRMSEYYAAWKLRGDEPKNYINGYFEEPDDCSKWECYAVNRGYPQDYNIRYNPECAYLYYLYHYCGRAKKEGEKVIEIKPSQQWIRCVKEVQREMKKWIGELGIGIETNPSSNYLISPFKRYDKHPIFSLYNIGLTYSEKELMDCPQLAVCINTDDQGIFSTYLENEYALLALALEKAKDEQGKSKYNRAMVYQWIENVRKQGLDLSFAENENDNSLFII